MMNTTKRAFPVLVAVVLMLGTFPALAQQAAPPAAPQSAEQAAPEKATVAVGQLQRVDATAKVIVIKTAQGDEMSFQFTDTTKVTGTDGEVAGLATKTGADVTVRYTMQDKAKIATEIQVNPKG